MKKIYLSCPYEFQDKTLPWKETVRELLGYNHELYDPCPDACEKNITNQLKLEGAWERIESVGKEIIRRDLEALWDCDACLVYLPAKVPTTGTIHEIISAQSWGMPIVLMAPDGLASLSVWMIGLVGLKSIRTSVQDGCELLMKKLEEK